MEGVRVGCVIVMCPLSSITVSMLLNLTPWPGPGPVRVEPGEVWMVGIEEVLGDETDRGASAGADDVLLAWCAGGELTATVIACGCAAPGAAP